MALISEIRKKSWLLLVMIGLGLAGFIIMDMTSNSQRAGSQFKMGSVDGKKIEWDAFQQLENTLYKNSTSEVYGRRDYIWNFLVDETIVKNTSDELGLAVSKPELMELQFGSNLSPVIQQRFANQQTGQVDRNQLNQIKQSIENGSMTEEVRPFWAFQEKEILKDRLQAKITTMVSKGLYIPTWMAEMELKDRQVSADIAFAKIPYDKVEDKAVTVDDADFKAYIKENQKKFEQTEEVRKIEFAAFPVVATSADTMALYKEMAALIEPFRNADSDSAFVESNGGKYDMAYYKKADLGLALGDSVAGQSVGTVVGPLVDDGKMRIAKITGRQIVPDSVRSRHILVKATNATELDAATKLIDSLKVVIETGKGSFDSLAMKFGSDGTKDKCGDLGYVAPGAMVKEFNDLIFYKAKPGKLETVVTQFGVHLVEVTGIKAGKGEMGYQLGQLSETIAPSEETQNKILSEIQQILTNNPSIEAFKKAMSKN
ncbi:MAG: peptidylprolyl isomerase, partial [Saprospiraceae bacterium]